MAHQIRRQEKETGSGKEREEEDAKGGGTPWKIGNEIFTRVILNKHFKRTRLETQFPLQLEMKL